MVYEKENNLLVSKENVTKERVIKYKREEVERIKTSAQAEIVKCDSLLAEMDKLSVLPEEEYKAKLKAERDAVAAAEAAAKEEEEAPAE